MGKKYGTLMESYKPSSNARKPEPLPIAGRGWKRRVSTYMHHALKQVAHASTTNFLYSMVFLPGKTHIKPI